MSCVKTKLVLLTSVLLLMSFVIPSVLALKPLRGTMALDRQPTNPVWVGTITIDNIEYKMCFTNIGTGKPYLSNPGKDLHFGEIWLITDFEDNLVLTGTDSGVVATANWKYRMNGVVTATNAAFEAYLGRQVHMDGIVLFVDGVISTAPGEFRID